MTKIEELTIGVQNAGFSGYMSGEQVTTYTQLLEVVGLLDFEISDGGMTEEMRSRALQLLEKLK